MESLAAGFYSSVQMPMAQYLSDPCDTASMSSGTVNDLITKSPAHVYARHPRFGAAAQDQSETMDIGTIAHQLLLGGDTRICEIRREDYRSKPTKDNPDGAIPVGWTNNAIREARDIARDRGLIPVLFEDMFAVRAMADAAREFLAQSEIAGVLDGAETEVTQIWQEGDTWFRARHDLVNHGPKIRLSYKTTKLSANPSVFIRSAISMGYHRALAFYRRGFEVLTDQRDWRDVILVQEQSAPYACSLIGLDPAMWAIADQDVERAIGIWRQCMASGKWPAYSGLIHYASPTPWMLAEAEAQMLEDGDE